MRALAPALHARFEDLDSLEDVDRAICAWRDCVREHRSDGEAWPGWINIPFKIGQVAAVRVLARQRRVQDLASGILLAAISPGLIDTGASHAWATGACESACRPLRSALESVIVARRSAATEPRVGILLKRAAQAMVRAKSDALKGVGLTLTSYVALTELQAQDGITAAMLARACLVSPQAIMIVLKSMEEQGLVLRSAHPRHANVLELHLTDVGRESLHAAIERVEPIERRVNEAFSSKEMSALRGLLTRFISAIDGE